MTVRTTVGHNCMLKMQVADALKPLISVSRICDARHGVVFHNQGGYIQHGRTRPTTAFYRDCSVYKMEVQAMGMPMTHFTWQGE